MEGSVLSSIIVLMLITDDDNYFMTVLNLRKDICFLTTPRERKLHLCTHQSCETQLDPVSQRLLDNHLILELTLVIQVRYNHKMREQILRRQ